MSRKGDFRPKTDLVGKRYTKLVVTEYAGYTVGNTGNVYHLWKCKCDCGNEIVAKGVMLNQKHKMSCGCISHRPKNPWHKHYLTDKPLYNVWKSMKGRCYTKGNSAYKWYGEKGITVCDEWKNDYMAFHNWAVSQGYTEENRRNCTVDRIDPNGNYCPENCRLATYIETRQAIANSTREILDFLVKDKIATLQAENADLRLAASQGRQNAYLINELRPAPVPAYTVPNPYAYPGCFCN